VNPEEFNEHTEDLINISDSIKDQTVHCKNESHENFLIQEMNLVSHESGQDGSKNYANYHTYASSQSDISDPEVLIYRAEPGLLDPIVHVAPDERSKLDSSDNKENELATIDRDDASESSDGLV